jgi:hypothetical protein
MTQNKAFFARTLYDDCAYKQELKESTGPFSYQMFDGKYENCNQCVENNFLRPFDRDIVDIESELSNRSRLQSRCPSAQYSPQCEKSSKCISTFDKTNPVLLPPEVCPIVRNNTRWTGGNGIVMPKSSNCTGVDVNTFYKNRS